MGKTKQTKNGVVTSVLFGLGGGSGSGRGVDWEQGHAQVQEQPQLWISPLRRRRGPSDSSGGPQREDVNGGRQRPIVRCNVYSLLCRHAAQWRGAGGECEPRAPALICCPDGG